MTRAKKDPYENHVEHPRFGRSPRFTGLNPCVFDVDVALGLEATSDAEFAAQMARLLADPREFEELKSLGLLEFTRVSDTQRIPETAVLADQSKQDPKSYSRRTHYFDLDKICADCKRPFLFFAEEQRHWFEVLGFSLDARCLRCVNCRKLVRNSVKLRQSYDHLLHVEPRTQAQNLSMAEILLRLMEAGTFSTTKTVQVRALLNKMAKQSLEQLLPNTDADQASLLQRVLAIEAGSLNLKSADHVPKSLQS